MSRMRILVSGFTAALVGIVAASAAATPIQIYGAWHCGSDFCTWASVRNMTEFDQKNHWLIDRGNGVPSVNVVNLSFVHPLRLLHHVNDAQTSDGVPIGMNQAVVDYFKNRSVRVMLSIGGITYTDAWNQALDEDPQGLAEAAAAAAQRLGVGIEIDYEENTNPRLDALQTFIDRYRALLPYDATGANAAARLTIDVAAGDRWLIALNRKATADWLNTSVQVLDYANAMVAARQLSASQTIANWQEHVDGKPQFSPPVLPLAPAKFTGSVYVAKGNRALPECVSFSGSLQSTTASFVQTVVPNVGATSGMLGYMFWAAECPGTRSLCTTPPNTCEGGVGVGATTLGIPIPMPPLRQN